VRLWRSYLVSSLACFIVLVMTIGLLDAGPVAGLGAIITYWAAQSWFLVAAYRDFLRDTGGRK